MSAEVRTTLATGGTLLVAVVALAVFAQNDRQSIRTDMHQLAARTDRRLDGMDRRLDGMDRRLDGMDRRLDAVEARLAGVEQRVESLDGRVSRIESRLDGLDGRVRAFETQMGRVLGALGLSAGRDPGLGSRQPRGKAAPVRRFRTAEPVPGTDLIFVSSAPRTPAPGWTTGN